MPVLVPEYHGRDPEYVGLVVGCTLGGAWCRSSWARGWWRPATPSLVGTPVGRALARRSARHPRPLNRGCGARSPRAWRAPRLSQARCHGSPLSAALPAHYCERRALRQSKGGLSLRRPGSGGGTGLWEFIMRTCGFLSLEGKDMPRTPVTQNHGFVAQPKLWTRIDYLLMR